MFKSADELLEEFGFEKLYEDKHGAYYNRKNEKYNYVQRLDILYKQNGSHLAQSYIEISNSDGFNNCVGLTYLELKATMRKYRELKRKYRW